MPHSKKAVPLKIVVFGDTAVGKTCFIDMFLQGKHFIRHSAVELNPLTRDLTVSSQPYTFSFMDLDFYMLRDSTAPSYKVFIEKHIAGADGIVLLYEITTKASFELAVNETYRYLWSCRASTRKHFAQKQRFGCVLVGNKADLVRGGGDEEGREVAREEAEQWAESQGFMHYEVSSNERGEVEGAVRALVASILTARKRDERDVEDQRRDWKEYKTKGTKSTPGYGGTLFLDRLRGVVGKAKQTS